MSNTLISKTIDAVEIYSNSNLTLETNTQIQFNTHQLLVNFIPIDQFIKHIVFDLPFEDLTTLNRDSANESNNEDPSPINLTDPYNNNATLTVDSVYCANVSANNSKVEMNNGTETTTISKYHCITFSTSNHLILNNTSDHNNIEYNRTGESVSSLSNYIYHVLNETTFTENDLDSNVFNTTGEAIDVSNFGTYFTNKIITSNVTTSNVCDGSGTIEPILDISSYSAVNLHIYQDGDATNTEALRSIASNIILGDNETNLKDYIYSFLDETVLYTLTVSGTGYPGVEITLNNIVFQRIVNGSRTPPFANDPFTYDIVFKIYVYDSTETATNPGGVLVSPGVGENYPYLNTVVPNSSPINLVTPLTFTNLTAGTFYSIYANITNKVTNTVVNNIRVESNIPTIPVKSFYTLNIVTPRKVTVDSETVNGLILKHTWTVSTISPSNVVQRNTSYNSDNYIEINDSAESPIYVTCLIQYMSGETLVFTITSPVEFADETNSFNNIFDLTSSTFIFISTTSYTFSFSSSNCAKLQEQVKDPSGNVVTTYATPGTYTLEVLLQNQFGFTKWVIGGTDDAIEQATAPVVHLTTSPSLIPYTIVNHDSIELHWTPNANGGATVVTYSISIDGGATYNVYDLSTTSYTLTSSNGITPSSSYNIIVKKVIVSPSGIGLINQSSSALPVTTEDVILKPIIDITQTIRQHNYIILHWLNNDSSDYTSNVRYDIYSPSGTLLVEGAVSPHTVDSLTHDTIYDFVVRKTVTSGAYMDRHANSDVENISTRRDYRASEEFSEVHGTTDSLDLSGGSGLTYDLTYKYFFTQSAHPSFRRFELWYGVTAGYPHPSGYYRTIDVEAALNSNGYVRHYRTYTWVRSETVTDIPQPDERDPPVFYLRTILFVDGQEFEYVAYTVRLQKFVMLERLSTNSFSVRQNFVSGYTTSYLVESGGSEVEYTTSGSNTFTVTGTPPGYTPGWGLNAPITVTFSHEIFDGDIMIIKRTVNRIVYPSDPSSLNWTATWLSNYIEAIAFASSPPGPGIISENSVSYTSIVIHYNSGSDGTPSETPLYRRLYYSTSSFDKTSLSVPTLTPAQPIDILASTGSNQTINGLSSGTPYYVRLIKSYSGGVLIESTLLTINTLTSSPPTSAYVESSHGGPTYIYLTVNRGSHGDPPETPTYTRIYYSTIQNFDPSGSSDFVPPTFSSNTYVTHAYVYFLHLATETRYYFRVITEYPTHGTIESTADYTETTMAPIVPELSSVWGNYQYDNSPTSITIQYTPGDHGNPDGTPSFDRIYYDTSSFTILSLPSTFFDLDFGSPQFRPSMTGLRPSSQYYARFIKEYPPFDYMGTTINYGSFESPEFTMTTMAPSPPTRCSISISSVSQTSLVLNFDHGFHGEPSGTPSYVRIYYDTESFMEEDAEGNRTITTLPATYEDVISVPDLTIYVSPGTAYYVIMVKYYPPFDYLDTTYNYGGMFRSYDWIIPTPDANGSFSWWYNR